MWPRRFKVLGVINVSSKTKVWPNKFMIEGKGEAMSTNGTKYGF